MDTSWKPVPLNIKTYDCSCGLVLYRDVNARLNIHKEAIEKLKSNGAVTVQIRARREAARGFMAYQVISDASVNREKFLSTRDLEAESHLNLR